GACAGRWTWIRSIFTEALRTWAGNRLRGRPTPPFGAHHRRRQATARMNENGTARGRCLLGPVRSRGSGGEDGAHLLQRIGLDLADALGGDAVLVGQLLQGGLGLAQEAAADDV